MQLEISRYNLEKRVIEHGGDKSVKHFRTKDLISTIMFGHLSGKNISRSIVQSLQYQEKNIYHMGLKGISRNNVSHALKTRSYKIVENLYYDLLNKFSHKNHDKRFRFKNPLKSIDSSTIGLCKNQFQWAGFRSTKSGIKIHTLLDNRSKIPDYLYISEAKIHDVNLHDDFPLSEKSIYIMDKGYLKFSFLQKIHKNKAFFVIRAKENTQFRVIHRNEKSQKNIRADWTIKFTGSHAEDYPDQLRLVKFYDDEKKLYIHI